MVFDEFCHKSSIFIKKDMETISYIVIPQQKLKSSTHSFELLMRPLSKVGRRHTRWFALSVVSEKRYVDRFFCEPAAAMVAAVH